MKELVGLRMRPSRDGKSFRYMLDYVDESGKRRQISLGHADKRRAERQRQEKKLELRVNIAEPVSMKLTDFFRDSLARTKRQVRATALNETARSMNDFIACVGNVDVQEVRYEHGERFIRYCFDRKLSAGTVTKKIKHLKRVFQLAEDGGQLDRHPLPRPKPPKVSMRKIRLFTDQECHKLCRAARQYEEKGSPVKWELLIRMCLATGMRRGELMNLTWRNIDFANLTIDVPPKVDRVDTWEWRIKDTDRRTFPLTNELVKLPVEHQMSQPEGNPHVFVPMERQEHIQELRHAGEWTVDRGRSPLSKFCHHFNKIRRLVSIESGTFHDLRRTCLNNWVTQGLSLHEVKELAGHAGIETAERFYLAVRKDVVDRARAASETSRKGHSVARLLRAPDEADEIIKTPLFMLDRGWQSVAYRRNRSEWRHFGDTPCRSNTDETTTLVWETSKASLSWDRIRIASQLRLLNIFLSASTVRNLLQRPKPPETPASPTTTEKTEEKPEARSIPAWRPNHVWSAAARHPASQPAIRNPASRRRLIPDRTRQTLQIM